MTMMRICEYIFKNLYQKYQNLNVHRYLSYSSRKNAAGIIIIGDEILKAQIQDTNSHFICKLLYECGVKVEKISVIGDNVGEIADEISYFSRRFKYVITSGGIGPTHDDMTYQGLAKAFNDQLTHHPYILNLINELYDTTEENSPGLKLAHIPTKSVLKFWKNEEGVEMKFPCINIDNVYVFPGSPVYLEPMFQSLHKELFDQKRTFVKKELFTNSPEHTFANQLTSVAQEFPHVSFGSYPISGLSHCKVRITIESDNEDEVDRAIDKFKSILPENISFRFQFEVDPDNNAFVNKDK